MVFCQEEYEVYGVVGESGQARDTKAIDPKRERSKTGEERETEPSSSETGILGEKTTGRIHGKDHGAQTGSDRNKSLV